MFCSENASFNLGDKIEVRVKDLSLENYKGLLELNGVPLVNIRKVGTGTITPRQTTVAEVIANIDQWQSTFVTVQGEYIPKLDTGTFGADKKATTNTIKDGETTINSYVSGYAKFYSETVPTGVKTITGIAGVNNNTPQLNIRNVDDIK